MTSPYLEAERDRLAKKPIAMDEDWARAYDFPSLEEPEPRPKEWFLSDFAITVIAMAACAVIITTCLYVVSM